MNDVRIESARSRPPTATEPELASLPTRGPTMYTSSPTPPSSDPAASTDGRPTNRGDTPETDAARRWQQVRRLFESALEQPTAERAAFVEAQTEDGSLAREVIELLAAHLEGSVLDRPIFELVPRHDARAWTRGRAPGSDSGDDPGSPDSSALGRRSGRTSSSRKRPAKRPAKRPKKRLRKQPSQASESPIQAPTEPWSTLPRADTHRPRDRPAGRLGPYHLEGVLGAGGMGTVYSARRVDGELEQVVAIKVLRADTATERTAERLRRERQILATLRHPNLARLLDAGTTDDGRPYFVMEQIDGVPLDRWARAGQPDTPDLDRRLRLFETLCRAVYHAHEHGVVHRDLKPGNILIDADDRPHVLDFGIAGSSSGSRQAGGRAFEHDLTDTAGAPMTLRYASPEQVAGKEVDARADVYALGVLLFELLTDSTPYGSKPALLDVMDVLLHGEIPPPSTVPGPWPRRLRGDLDAIVGQCLDRRPAGRYDDAGALAEDLRAHREQRPVGARKIGLGGAWHTIGRRLRARRLPLSIAALLATLVGFGSWQWQSDQDFRRLDAERTSASRTTLGAADQLAELGDQLERVGRSQEARQALQQAVELRSLSIDSERPPSTTPGQAEALVRDLATLGDLQLRHGAFAAAAESHRRTLELLRQHDLGDDPRHALSLTALGLAEKRLGRLQEGERRLLHGLRLADSLFGNEPEVLARALHRYGRSAMELGDLTTASNILSTALAQARRFFSEGHPDLLTFQYSAASAAAIRGHVDEAEALLGTARRSLERLPADHPLRLLDVDRRAFLDYLEGRLEQAEAGARQALAGSLERFGEVHPAVHLAYRTLCPVLREQGRLAEAADVCARTVEVAVRLHGAGHPFVGDALILQAEAIEPIDRAAAMSLLDQAAIVYQGSVGNAHPMVARIYHYRSLAHSLAGDTTTADRFHEQAVAIYRQTLGERHPSLAYALDQYARQLARRGETAAASERFRRSIEIMELGLGPDHVRSIWPLSGYALHLLTLGDARQARDLARRALDRAPSPTANGAPQARAALARASGLLGDDARRRQVERELLDLLPDLDLRTRRQLATLYRRWQRPEMALRLAPDEPEAGGREHLFALPESEDLMP